MACFLEEINCIFSRPHVSDRNRKECDRIVRCFYRIRINFIDSIGGL